MIEKTTDLLGQKTLELQLKCDRQGKTIFAHRYATSPLRLSQTFRLDGANSNRAYIYLMNSSPGLLAGDRLNLSLQLDQGCSLYLTDQAATKVHAMPNVPTQATTNWEINLNAEASLELVPEPIILFADSALEQSTRIQLHSQASLFWSEILVPGRLARGESNAFRHYHNSWEICDSTGTLLFKDATHLEGVNNPWRQESLYASLPILATAIIVEPQADLKLLSQELEKYGDRCSSQLVIASSNLPDDLGLLVRIMAAKTAAIKDYLTYALNCVRQIGDRPKLPYIPK